MPFARTPYFCSGCPHNTSTRVPEGSRALAGIGCHYLSQFMDRNTATFTQMGGEGASWIGQAPFVETTHVFANIGDGTYTHSGILAIRAAVAAGVTMTYKVLFNDAVAMTGGQPLDGGLTVPRVAAQLAAEGVRQVVIVSDEPRQIPARHAVPARRDACGTATSSTRCSANCARWAASPRSSTTRPAPPKSAAAASAAVSRTRRNAVFINDLVCEGCGDCSAASNCLSVVPVETEFGRKRAIDQSSCNKDFSCLKGFCPSFVTVHGGSLRKRSPADLARGRPAAAARAGAARPRRALRHSGHRGRRHRRRDDRGACSAWRRIWRGKASPCSTSSAWRRRAAR